MKVKSAVQSKYRIQVTEADIAKAKRNDSYNCVVMQAIARTIPTSTSIEVDSQAVRFTVEDQRLIFLTPYTVAGYVVAFDAGDPIEPFSFELRNARRVRRRLRTDAGRQILRATGRVRRETAKKSKVANSELPASVAHTKVNS